MATEKETHEPNLQMINGLPFSLMFRKDKIEEALNFQSQMGDVIIATYPKTGTTWMQYIVLQILTGGEDFPPFNDVLEKHVPYIDMVGVSAVEDLKTRPRAYKTHLPYNMMKTDPGSKVIYVYRKPEDTFVSFYHFMNNMMGNLNFDRYFEDFMRGFVSYGSYFEHILSYWNHRNERNMLLLSYEKLQADTRKEILGVAKFMGEEFYERLASDQSIMDKILLNTSFGHMQKNLKLVFPENPARDNYSKDVPQKQVNFFRKGKVGDGKRHLSETQLKRLKTLATETLKGTDILQEWYSNEE
ncbi:sulfotransferase 1B1 [Parasteatoda tepidariorum]|uniref:sulfotransferase 1B1 n=1 Tax=Parasteatoda tepidariorum TaxID=114398 RepID=UPI001C727140|nr:sulfotransferase family cytosolic 1B member 1 [Parasteatoda tepidariorum]XP_042899410.1 sulfotransferase family cytosolic 1B member 1 [Parasteatoda tepidariorum]XP_042899412.1 sulfotransferase family cytosolic 1B member 1 [Parasteatoda tepidariorum]